MTRDALGDQLDFWLVSPEFPKTQHYKIFILFLWQDVSIIYMQCTHWRHSMTDLELDYPEWE